MATVNKYVDPWMADGGPAFPIELPAGNGAGPTNYKGLTVRDYFAAKALPECMARADRASMLGQLDAGDTFKCASQWAFGQADAMLKARKP